MKKHMIRGIQALPVFALAAAMSTAAMSGETVSRGTRADLLAAMKDEAFSCLRYKIFAEQAQKNGNTKLAALFEKIAGDELDKHFRKQAELLGTVKSDKENLTAAISDEYLEAAKMYSEMAKKAEEAGDGKAAQHFTAAAADEAEHRKAFRAILAKPTGAAD
jgi:rubrerythrin